MRLPQVTRFLSLWTTGAASAAMMLAFGSAAFANQSESEDASQVVIVPQPAVEAGEPQLVPPAPEAALVAVQAQDPLPQSPGDGADVSAGGVEIIPAPSAGVSINGNSYEAVYRSIPYSYTEYLANPGYRHEATMEILFGQLRPTTVVKQYEPRIAETPLPSPYQPYRWSHSERWQYRAPDFRLLDPGCCW